MSFVCFLLLFLFNKPLKKFVMFIIVVSKQTTLRLYIFFGSENKSKKHICKTVKLLKALKFVKIKAQINLNNSGTLS